MEGEERGGCVDGIPEDDPPSKSHGSSSTVALRKGQGPEEEYRHETTQET